MSLRHVVRSTLYAVLFVSAIDAQPRALRQYDQGPVEPGFHLPAMTLLLKQSPSQQADLARLLAQQQNPASPNYHRWLTPEQYADRFGLAPGDIHKITAWLQSQGFATEAVARSRTWIVFSGTAGQAQRAFHTAIHRYSVKGETHFSNTSDPSVPADLRNFVSAVRGLHNFFPNATPLTRLPAPDFTASDGSHHLVPDDVATIYGIAPLLQAGIDGSGQTIAIIGLSNVHLEDVQSFRSRFNLSTPDPQVILVPNYPDPGFNLSGAAEAALDIEWVGAVARNANIVYVYSQDAFDAVTYAVDNNLAPVLSMSISACEQQDLINLPFFQGLAQQANAQGMTWINSAGDAGAAACDPNGAVAAENGPAVRFPASIPEVTGVGGTQFDEQSGNYWNGGNDVNGASALSYIPETSWNSVALRHAASAGGGGASVFFPKPAWQAAPGVPNDGFRDVPDVAFAASADVTGYYAVANGTANYYGGTSLSTPVFTGIVALLNQYLVSSGALTAPGLANINPTLYRLAQNTSGVFHDVTTGNNNVPCASQSPNCDTGSFGYSAGPGYDQVTGLGSLDANSFVHQWSSQPAVNSAVVASIAPNPVYQQPADNQGAKWIITITLTEEAGIGTDLTDFTIDGVSHASDIAMFFGTAAIPPNGSIRAGVGFPNIAIPKTVVFTFTGVDAGGQTWTQQLSVPFNGPQEFPHVDAAVNAASLQPAYAPGMIATLYGSKLGSSTQAATVTPLPRFMSGFSAYVNGFAAPLIYVSYGQVSLQIPYETPIGTATIVIFNGEQQTAKFSFPVTASAPGIFVDQDGALVPNASGTRGQVASLFITGDGQLSPSLADGRSPAAGTSGSRLPKPVLPVTVTLAGATVASQVIGVTPGMVGMTRIDFTVPSDAPLGQQQVIVTVGDAASPPANFTISP